VALTSSDCTGPGSATARGAGCSGSASSPSAQPAAVICSSMGTTKTSLCIGRVVVLVLDPGKGVCADPVNGSAILGKGGPDPHSRDRERQLAPDKGRGKT
jgi:hypothetical protein